MKIINYLQAQVNMSRKKVMQNEGFISMASEFNQFSFGGGDFQLQMEGLGSSFTEVGSLNLGETGAASTATSEQTKKRKIDKDGFVTPATPDIPKSSSHYGESSHTDEQLPEFENNYTDEDESVSEYCLNEETTEQDNKAEDSHDQTGESHEDDMFFRNSNVSEIMPSTISATTTSVQDVIKGLGQEAKLLQIQWAERFKESEDFELLCQSQLDSYIEGAKSLETTLNRQKDVLFGRLQGLGKTLQL